MDAEPSLSADGNLIAFASDRPGGAGGRDIYLFDRAAGKFRRCPGLNTPAHEYSPVAQPRRPLHCVRLGAARRRGRARHLPLRPPGQKLPPTPGLNSKTEDFDPCVMVLNPGE